MKPDTLQDVLFLGGGPAGTGPLVCGLRDGLRQELAALRICVIDRTHQLMRGTIGEHVLNSDTLSDVLLESLNNPRDGVFSPMIGSSAVRTVQQYSGHQIPLRHIGDYYAALGKCLHAALLKQPRWSVEMGIKLTSLERTKEGYFQAHGWNGRGQRQAFLGRNVVTALGGYQDEAATKCADILPGLNLRHERYASKVVLTGRLFKPSGIRYATERLRGVPSPRVAIIGGSHSAFSSAWVMLHRIPGVGFAPGSISIHYRRKPKLAYGSAEEAIRDGYSEFTWQDICPKTKRVHRLAGLKFDSKDLARKVFGLNKTEREPRVRCVALSCETPESMKKVLDAADIIIPAFGYRPRTLPLFGHRGEPVRLYCEQVGRPLVDDLCRVLDGTGQPIPGFFGIGLASGFVPSGPLGGEPSFAGQTNGLWLYQNGVGRIVLDGILDRTATRRAAKRSRSSSPSVRSAAHPLPAV